MTSEQATELARWAQKVWRGTSDDERDFLRSRLERFDYTSAKKCLDQLREQSDELRISRLLEMLQPIATPRVYRFSLREKERTDLEWERITKRLLSLGENELRRYYEMVLQANSDLRKYLKITPKDIKNFLASSTSDKCKTLKSVLLKMLDTDGN